MIIAARNAILAGGGGWKNPYVTDGLVAMWDGEWNAGPGKHDANATTCVDLSGNENDITRYGSAPVGSNYLSFDGSTCYQTVNNIDISNGATFEIVGDFNTPASGEMEFFAWGRQHGNNAGMSFHNYSTVIRSLLVLDSGRKFFSWNFTTAGLLANRGSISLSFDSVAYAEMYRNSTLQVAYGYNSPIVAPSNKVVLIGAEAPFYNPSNFLYGNANSIRLYNRALTAAEIAANYAVDKARFNLA